MEEPLNNVKKTITMGERWQSDIKGIALMIKNQEEKPKITKEIREYIKKEYNITLLENKVE